MYRCCSCTKHNTAATMHHISNLCHSAAISPFLHLFIPFPAAAAGQKSSLAIAQMQTSTRCALPLSFPHPPPATDSPALPNCTSKLHKQAVAGAARTSPARCTGQACTPCCLTRTPSGTAWAWWAAHLALSYTSAAAAAGSAVNALPHHETTIQGLLHVHLLARLGHGGQFICCYNAVLARTQAR